MITLDVPQLAQALLLEPGANSQSPQAAFEVAVRESSERVELAAARDQVEQPARRRQTVAFSPISKRTSWPPCSRPAPGGRPASSRRRSGTGLFIY